MEANNRSFALSDEQEKKILAWQIGAFITAFVLFIPVSLITLYLFNGSIKYIFIPVSIPLLYIGVSSIKNQLSIIRMRGQKGPSRGRKAIVFGILIIVLLPIELLFIFVP